MQDNGLFFHELPVLDGVDHNGTCVVVPVVCVMHHRLAAELFWACLVRHLHALLEEREQREVLFGVEESLDRAARPIAHSVELLPDGALCHLWINLIARVGTITILLLVHVPGERLVFCEAWYIFWDAWVLRLD